MAHPPGSDTRAFPCRARSGPRTRTGARIVFPGSWGASYATRRFASRTISWGERFTHSTPRSFRSRRIVPTSQTSGTFVSWSGSSVRSEAAISGSEAFLAPPTETRPERRFPPAIRSLSTDLLALSGDHHPGNSREVGNDAKKIESDRKDPLRHRAVLPFSDLHHHDASSVEHRSHSLDESRDGGEAVGAAGESHSRLVLLDLGGELSDLGVDDVRRIAHHEVEFFSPLHERVEEVAMEERDALVDAVGGRVLPRDREGRGGGVDREKRGLGALASDRDRDAAASASDVGDRGSALGAGGKLRQGLIDDQFRLRARNENRGGHAKRKAVELLRSQDVLDGY